MLTEVDFKNIMLLLQHGTYNGLSEAEVAVVLAQKVRRILTPPPPPAPPSEDAKKE